MRRSEFVADPPGTIGDLIDFCNEYNLCAAEDIINGDDLDECVCDDIRNCLNNEYWYNIRDALDGIPEGCVWYARDGSFEYADFDDGWETLYDNILDEMDNDGKWDDEEDEEDEDDDEEWGADDGEEDLFGDSGSYDSLIPDGMRETKEDPEASGVFSLDDLFDSDAVSVIRAEAEESERKSKEAAEESVKAFARLKRERDDAIRRLEAEEEEARVSGFGEVFGF